MDDKYEDDGERAGLEYMLEMIDDKQMPGLPFKVDDLKLRTDSDEASGDVRKSDSNSTDSNSKHRK